MKQPTADQMLNLAALLRRDATNIKDFSAPTSMRLAADMLEVLVHTPLNEETLARKNEKSSE